MLDTTTIRRIAHHDTGGLPVVSLYLAVPADPAEHNAVPTRINSLLDEVRPLVDDEELDRPARMSLRADLEWLSSLGRDGLRPGGLAVFACSGADLREVIELPVAVRDRIVVDSTPWLRPLFAIADDIHRYGVIVLDGSSAQLYEMVGDELTAASAVRHERLRAPRYGGWYGLDEHGVRNRAEGLRLRHYRAVADAADEMVRLDGVDHLIVGGMDQHVNAFVDQLPHALRQRLAGTFTIDLHTATPARIADAAREVIARHEAELDRRLATEILDAVGGSDRAVAGLDEVLWAASLGAVDHLVVVENVTVPGVRCPGCGWLGTRGATCPVCGGETVEVPDVIDEAVAAVFDAGGLVDHLAPGDSPLDEHLVAARLRFPLPPVPETAAA